MGDSNRDNSQNLKSDFMLLKGGRDQSIQGSELIAIIVVVAIALLLLLERKLKIRKECPDIYAIIIHFVCHAFSRIFNLGPSPNLMIVGAWWL